MSDEQVAANLNFINTNFQILSGSLSKLEERKPLAESIRLMKKAQESVKFEPFVNEFNSVMWKNPGFEELNSLCDEKFKFAPVCILDVEKCFMWLKELMHFRRLAMSEKHLRDQIIILWNMELLQEKSDKSKAKESG